jgi:TP901 family phage tail tape measure protein
VPTDLKVTIDANAASLERELRRTYRSMEQLENQLRRDQASLQQWEDRQARALQGMGRGMVAFGAAALAGLGLATHAAMQWESAWAGVRKTTSGTPAEMAALERELRNLARTLPATHQEIAGIAEAAGQLGVARQDISAFTRVMVMLGETTNLTADEAATSIAQMMNVMQTAPRDVGRLAAALVDLGNNGASTERDILELAKRIAGAGQVVGLSEAEVLSFANAIASVGIEAEAGGSSISRVMITIADSVASGGDALDEFARVSGMSAEEFARAFRDDPAAAIAAFIGGLGDISAAGGNVFAVLDQLGLGEIRVRDGLLRLSGAGDLLTESLARGNAAWEANTALVAEAEKRFDTAEAKVQIAKNALVDLAIDVGGVILPAVAGLADGVADVANFLADLPGPVKTVATILGAVAGTASLAAGAFLLLAPRIAAARDLFLDFARSHKVAAGAMITAGQAAAIAGGMLMIAAAIEAAYQASLDTATGVGEMTEALLKLRQGDVTSSIDKLIEKRNELADRNMWADIVLGTLTMSRGWDGTRKAADELANELEAVDAALTQLVQSGETEAAAQAARALGEAWEASGGNAESLMERLPDYRDALKSASAQQELAAETAGPLEDSLVTLATQFGLTGEDAAKAAQEMLDAWGDAAAEFIDFAGAYDQALAVKEAAERETAEATAAATDDATDSWEDFVGDVAVTVDEYLDELDRQVQAQIDWEKNLLTIAGRVPDELFNELVKAGPKGADAVAMFAQMTNEELARATAAWERKTQEGAGAIARRLAEAGPVLATIANTHGQKVASSIAAGMAKNGTTVYEEAKRQGVNIDKGVGTGRTRVVPISPRVAEGSIAALNKKLQAALTARYIDVHFRYREPAGGAGGAGGFGEPVGLFPAPGGAGRYRITQGSHDGGAIDYAMPVGTPLYAPYAGLLTTTDLGNRSYGKYYSLSGSGYYSLGAHLSQIRADGYVARGARIGASGDTGNSTGPHLHYLIRRYHGGGLVDGIGGWGDEVPAILQLGERVLSRQQNRVWSALEDALGRRFAQPVLPTAGDSSRGITVYAQVSPWDARVPGLMQAVRAAAEQVVNDLRTELKMASVRGGAA